MPSINQMYLHIIKTYIEKKITFNKYITHWINYLKSVYNCHVLTLNIKAMGGQGKKIHVELNLNEGKQRLFTECQH